MLIASLVHMERPDPTAHKRRVGACGAAVTGFGARAMRACCSQVAIEVSIGDGPGTGMAWGCDLSYDYVKINAEYTT